MWKKIKSLYSNKPDIVEDVLSPDFDRLVKHSIFLIENSQGLNSDEDFLDHLIENGIPRSEAIEILLFLPIAFVRQLFSSVKWLDTYLEYVDKNRALKKQFSQTKSYQTIWQVTTEYFKDNPKKDTILKIGMRSAEFNAINHFLHNNLDLKLEGIKLSQTVIIR